MSLFAPRKQRLFRSSEKRHWGAGSPSGIHASALPPPDAKHSKASDSPDFKAAPRPKESRQPHASRQAGRHQRAADHCRFSLRENSAFFAPAKSDTGAPDRPAESWRARCRRPTRSIRKQTTRPISKPPRTRNNPATPFGPPGRSRSASRRPLSLFAPRKQRLFRGAKSDSGEAEASTPGLCLTRSGIAAAAICLTAAPSRARATRALPPRRATRDSRSVWSLCLRKRRG